MFNDDLKKIKQSCKMIVLNYYKTTFDVYYDENYSEQRARYLAVREIDDGHCKNSFLHEIIIHKNEAGEEMVVVI